MRRFSSIFPFCLAMLAVGAAIIGLRARSPSPVDVKLVAVGASGASNSQAVTVEFTRRGSNWIAFTDGLKVQARVAGSWLQPQPFPELPDSYLLRSTNRESVQFLIPRQAEACRFLLTYRIGSSPYCKAYSFLYRHGLMQRFTKACRWALKPLAGRSGWQHATQELVLPTRKPELALLARPSHNLSIQRMGPSRVGQLQVLRQWRLAPTADAGRWTYRAP